MLLFGLVLIASSAATVLLVMTYWVYYRSYPLQVVELDSRTSLDEFLFPAVTVCSAFKIKMSRADEFISRTLGVNATEEEKASYRNSLVALSLQQYPHYNFALEFIELLNFSSLYPIKNQEIPYIMKQVSHQIEDIFAECQWRGELRKCSDIFKEQRTEEGFCYSFNSKTAAKSMNATILKNSLAGRNTGLDISLKDPDEKTKWQLKSRINMAGYNIIVQNPEEVPDASVSYPIRQSGDKINRITVRPKIVFPDDNLKDIPAKVRDCYWVGKSEIEAEIEENGPCHAQCRRAIIWKSCNCIPYFYETKPGMIYCGIEQSKCLSDVNVMLRNFDYHNIEKVEQGDILEDYWGCNCKRLCAIASYTTQLISSPHYLRLSMDEYAHVDVSYLHQWGQTYRKELKFTFKDLSVTVGGYASLLLGCSLITILEMVYFLFRFIGVLYLQAAGLLHPRNRVKDLRTSRQSLIYPNYQFLP